MSASDHERAKRNHKETRKLTLEKSECMKYLKEDFRKLKDRHGKVP